MCVKIESEYSETIKEDWPVCAEVIAPVRVKESSGKSESAECGVASGGS